MMSSAGREAAFVQRTWTTQEVVLKLDEPVCEKYSAQLSNNLKMIQRLNVCSRRAGAAINQLIDQKNVFPSLLLLNIHSEEKKSR